MKILNGEIFSERNTFVPANLIIKGELIHEIDYSCSSDLRAVEDCLIDATNCYIIPGLTDIHLHGCNGFDFCDGTTKALDAITSYQLSHGITTITPASMTLSEEKLTRILSLLPNYPSNTKTNASLLGVYLEGPFLSFKKKGAQNANYIIRPDVDFFQRLQNVSGDKIRTVAIAPEEENAIEFIRTVSNKVTVSIAHTNCDYTTAKKAMDAGAHQVTHLYNAMPCLHHRAPGVIGAAFDSGNCSVELICDGIHIDPCVVRMTFQLYGDDRVILISDSMSATGMPDGNYSLGSQHVIVKDSVARLCDGTIAGSTTNLYRCMCNAIRMGIPKESAIKAACVNPIKALGFYQNYGSISIGKHANLLIITKDYQIKSIIKDGVIYKKPEFVAP